MVEERYITTIMLMKPGVQWLVPLGDRFHNSLKSRGDLKKKAVFSHEINGGEQSCGLSVGSIDS